MIVSTKKRGAAFDAKVFFNSVLKVLGSKHIQKGVDYTPLPQWSA